jgi:site-specific recombinase XerD
MTEKKNDFTYIDGKRVKNGCNYYTPILPPAMEVLVKYNYQLPKISNQKANDYLHLIESRAGIHKPITMHVARHSFATLAIANGVPVENVSRMVGHTNIKTTQIYAHILKSTIEMQAESLAAKIR